MFKAGDRVERTGCHATGIEVGDIVTVGRKTNCNGEVYIEGFQYPHSANFFKLISESDALSDAIEGRNDPEPTIEQLVESNAELGETIKALEEELRGHRREYDDVAGLIRKMVAPGCDIEGSDTHVKRVETEKAEQRMRRLMYNRGAAQSMDWGL